MAALAQGWDGSNSVCAASGVRTEGWFERARLLAEGRG